jgi:hypothetical protein
MAWKGSAGGLRTTSNTATTSLLPCPCWSTAARVGANKASCATSAEFGTRLLSDQLSDYRVDDPYIQAHLHGPSSRLVLDLGDSLNVLRDEEVAGSNPVTPTSGMPGQIHIEILDRSVRAASTAAKYSSISVQDVSKSPQCLACGSRTGICVNLHRDCLVGVPKDSHDHAGVHI